MKSFQLRKLEILSDHLMPPSTLQLHASEVLASCNRKRRVKNMITILRICDIPINYSIIYSRYTLDDKFNTKVWDFCYLLEASTIPPEKLGVLGRNFPHFGLRSWCCRCNLTFRILHFEVFAIWNVKILWLVFPMNQAILSKNFFTFQIANIILQLEY